MRINHNISAMNAHRLLNINNAFASKSLEKLSSGKRINRAGDDAAGMAITEKMRAQINGLKMASRNSLDGVSLVQTAEGAMSEIHSMLQRMRELCVQAANGTMSSSDRQAIQDEINQLTSEVNRIANGTEYNTRNILKGNEGPNSHTLVHRMSTGESAQYRGNVDLTAVGAGGFNLSSDQLSIWVDGEEKVVNLTGTDNSTTLDNFMELVNDALGDSAKAVLDKDGHIEITTLSIGGSSKIEINGSQNAVRLFKSGWSTGNPNPSATGTAESATSSAKGYFYFDSIPEVGSTIKIGNETIEFFDSSVAPYVGSNRPIDINGKANAEDVVDEIIS
ncbi:flagellin N-terminal helical domain-containing protein, partial [Tepidibacter thalassicus]